MESEQMSPNECGGAGRGGGARRWGAGRWWRSWCRGAWRWSWSALGRLWQRLSGHPAAIVICRLTPLAEATPSRQMAIAAGCPGDRCWLSGRWPGPAPGLLAPGPPPPPRASLVCCSAALRALASRVLLQNSVSVGRTTTLLAARALPKNCSCVHLICWRSLASPPPAWL